MADEMDDREEVEEIEEIEAPEEVEEAKEAEPTEEDRYAEALAQELGWAPKDKWRGPEEDWADAKTFLRSTVDINKTLRRDLKATRESAERAARAAAAITERELEKQRRELLAARQEAFNTGDEEAFNQADEQLQKLPQTGQQADPAVSDFAERNASWFRVDPIATQVALATAQAYADKGADAATQVAEAEKMIRRRFPEYFKEESSRQTKRPAAVETGTSRSAAPSKRGPKGFNELPADAKAAALDFEKRGRASKEEYAQLYWQENA